MVIEGGLKENKTKQNMELRWLSTPAQLKA